MRTDRYERVEDGLSFEIGGRLKEAREAVGMSQHEFGDLMGYAGAMISAFEKGRRRMKLEDLARACIVLGKTPDFFLGTKPAVPDSIGLALRAEVATLPQDELKASLERFLDDVDRDAMTVGGVPDLSYLQPEAAAREILSLAGASAPPVEMQEICQELALPLHHRDDFPESLSALIMTISDGRYVMGVNGRHHVNRRRFSEAHELGHAVLRHEASYYVEFNSAGEADEPPGYRYLDEREANAFAAALLMDARWVREDFANGLTDVGALAHRYVVSEVAMSFRLVNLGLTSG